MSRRGTFAGLPANALTSQSLPRRWAQQRLSAEVAAIGMSLQLIRLKPGPRVVGVKTRSPSPLLIPPALTGRASQLPVRQLHNTVAFCRLYSRVSTVSIQLNRGSSSATVTGRRFLPRGGPRDRNQVVTLTLPKERGPCPSHGADSKVSPPHKPGVHDKGTLHRWYLPSYS